MQVQKRLLARWQSRGGKYWIDLFAETLPNCVASYSYSGNGCGGFIGTVAPEVAMQHAARQANYSPSKMPRVFFDETLAAEVCSLWNTERRAFGSADILTENRARELAKRDRNYSARLIRGYWVVWDARADHAVEFDR